ncbi:hypothetical protein Btru_062639 [Bulinus truncatus]|nr:hypothetical protein Btru_062639 [Bulinus truncatus]
MAAAVVSSSSQGRPNENADGAGASPTPLPTVVADATRAVSGTIMLTSQNTAETSVTHHVTAPDNGAGHFTGVRSTPPLRRVISNLDHVKGKIDYPSKLRRTNSFSDMQDKQPPVHKVRFYIGVPQAQNRARVVQAVHSIDSVDSSPQDNASLSRSRMSSFKSFFRGSSKRKKRKSTEEAPDADRLDCSSNRKSSQMTSADPSGANTGTPRDEDHIIVSPGEGEDEKDDLEADLIDETLSSRPWVSRFQRSHSTKSRVGPPREDEEMEAKRISRSVTEGNFLSQAPTLILTSRGLRYHSGGLLNQINAVPDTPQDDVGGKRRHALFGRSGHRQRERKNKSEVHSQGSRRQSFRKFIIRLLTGRRRPKRDTQVASRGSHKGLTGYLFCYLVNFDRVFVLLHGQF